MFFNRKKHIQGGRSAKFSTAMIRIVPFFLFHRLSFHIIFDSPFPLFSISLAVASFLKAFFQRSSPLLGRFISMFSSPPLPPPLFHPKHISQPRLSASLTSYPPPPPPSCPHVAITLPPLPSALISPLPVLSLSSLPNSSSSLSPNASSSLQCLCVCVCVWSQVNTHPYWLLTFYPQ